MIRMGMADQNDVNIAKPGIRTARYRASRIIENAHTGRIFEDERPVCRAKVARARSHRRDFDGLRLHNRYRRDECKQQHEDLRLAFEHYDHGVLLIWSLNAVALGVGAFFTPNPTRVSTISDPGLSLRPYGETQNCNSHGRGQRYRPGSQSCIE